MSSKISEEKEKSKTSEKTKWLYIIGLLLSIAGIADTTYLTIAHYNTKVVLACPETTFINCAKVTSSSYSEVFGIPVALFGLLFFVAMFIYQTPWAWLTANRFIRYTRLLLSLSGLASIFWLIFVEFHRLHAICLFCTAVHILTFGLFILTMIGTAITAPEELSPKSSSKTQA